ncbi:unnamed protein product [Ectocarpus sp. CCAP 1310/34]|nr:unnamed protein product [Ectocarpus sp. CCAP 1310/34]
MSSGSHNSALKLKRTSRMSVASLDTT